MIKSKQAERESVPFVAMSSNGYFIDRTYGYHLDSIKVNPTEIVRTIKTVISEQKFPKEVVDCLKMGTELSLGSGIHIFEVVGRVCIQDGDYKTAEPLAEAVKDAMQKIAEGLEKLKLSKSDLVPRDEQK